MMNAIAPYITRIRRSYQSNDIIDRLNYQYTSMIIGLSAITLAATQYVGKPIQCWVPAEFTGAWEKYAETYCFVKGSYFLPTDEQIPDSYAQRERTHIGYYQWVPLVLAAQAILFYLPSFIWKAFNFHTGINVKSVLNSAAMVKKKFDKGTRSAQVTKAAQHLAEAIEMQKELKTSTFFLSQLGKSQGTFLTALYLVTKLLYVLNVLLQFVILNEFLGPQYTFWGVGILSDIWNGREWSESGHFPRVTLCDFNVRVLGNIHRWSVQCTLMINMFNEKVYLFLWFWFILVGVLSVLSLLYWFFATLLPGQQKEFVEKYLRCSGAIAPNGDHGSDGRPAARSADPLRRSQAGTDYVAHKEQRMVTEFTRHFLRTDGVFLLRLIQTNGGDLLVGEIVTSLFNHYRGKLEPVEFRTASSERPESSAQL